MANAPIISPIIKSVKFDGIGFGVKFTFALNILIIVVSKANISTTSSTIPGTAVTIKPLKDAPANPPSPTKCHYSF